MTPFYGWDSTVVRLQNHYERTVYFLPLSLNNFLGLILLTLEGRKAESALESPIRKPAYIEKYVFHWTLVSVNSSLLLSN